MSLLYVYGTLMRGQRNHWRLPSCPYLGKARMHGELFQFWGYDFPILRRHPKYLVDGELYKVDNEILALQDCFELWYKRVKATAYMSRSYSLHGPLSCWVYEGLDCLPLRLARRLLNGRWPA